ncbi:MAG: hypothetical protein O2876_10995, partial [Proteobacteria bacterium]|nr:hypothetical protein [Pseudomonadota bacterium]
GSLVRAQQAEPNPEKPHTLRLFLWVLGLWVLACAALNSIWVKKNRMPLEAFRRPPSEID